jgi:hypothetical protein
MLAQDRLIAPEALARRIAELIPEYLPGMDTGAAEATDRRICWNKTFKALLSAIAAEHSMRVEVDPLTRTPQDEQLDLYWKRGDGIVLAALTGWGDRNSLERRLQRLEALKAIHKLFIYTCNRWQEAVLEQINAALLRFPFHVAGEQYIFVNLLGTESSMHVHAVEITADGPLKIYRPDFVRPVSGSPFPWTRRGGRQS